MSATATEPCDCLNWCGDDSRVGEGKVCPYDAMLASQERKRQVDLQLAKLTELRKIYGAATLYDLMDKMHAAVVRQKGEAKVLRDLLEMSLTVIDTIEEDDAHERGLLKEFKGHIVAAVEAQRVWP